MSRHRTAAIFAFAFLAVLAFRRGSVSPLATAGGHLVSTYLSWRVLGAAPADPVKLVVVEPSECSQLLENLASLERQRNRGGPKVLVVAMAPADSLRVLERYLRREAISLPVTTVSDRLARALLATVSSARTPSVIHRRGVLTSTRETLRTTYELRP